MSTNTWHLTGPILGHGVRGKQYPKLWIRIGLPSNASTFVEFDLPTDLTTSKGKQASYIQSQIDNSKFAVITDMKITKLKFSKKEGDEWVTTERDGLKGYIQNLSILPTRPKDLNLGTVKGNIVFHEGEKVLIQEKYRIVKDNSWGERNVPVVLNNYDGPSLVGTPMLAICEAKVTNEGRDSKIYGYSDQYFALKNG